MKHLFTCLFLLTTCFAYDYSFVALDSNTNEIVMQIGSDHHVQISPHSTFKIALALMGYEKGILIDENNPVWPYEGQDCFLKEWEGSQNPKSWMTYSVIWYSRILTPRLGFETIVNYLHAFDYGNCDFSGGLAKAWLGSSLQISPIEQLYFLQKLVRGELPVTIHAHQMTKKLIFLEHFDDWDLFAKTGTGDDNSWLVGWFEKENRCYLFALCLKNYTTWPSKAERVNLVKDLMVPLLK